MSDPDVMSKVITEVQQHPILWKMGLEAYKRGDQKENAWKTISDKLGLTVNEIRDIWSKARTKFSKLKNEYDLASRSGAATVSEPDWPFYKSLKFLIGNCRKVKKNSTVTNFKVQEIVTAAAAPRSVYEDDSNMSDAADLPSTSKVKFMNSSPIFLEEDVAKALEAALPESSLSCSSEVEEKISLGTFQLFPQASASKDSEENSFLSGVQKIIQSIPRPEIACNNPNPDMAFGAFVGSTLMGMDEETKKEKKRYITSILFE